MPVFMSSCEPLLHKHLGSRDPPVGCALVGAKSVAEIDELVESLRISVISGSPVFDTYTPAVAEFEKKFGEIMRSFDPLDHFDYDKTRVKL